MEEKKELLDQDERVVEIELERLRGFVNHPFKVQADSQMIELQESIKKYGILNPLIVRPRQDGTYEIISGHRRKFAAEKIGYRTVIYRAVSHVRTFGSHLCDHQRTYGGDLSRVQKRRFSSKGGARTFWESGFSKPVKKSIKDVKRVTLASSDLPRRETTRGTIAYRKNRELGKPSTHD